MGKRQKHKVKTDGKETQRDSRPMLFALILICFFISGFTGLVYEILWIRMIVKIIGSAPFAVSIVLTVFMGGLGLGSYIASRTIDRIESPGKLVRLYGTLELVIGGYGFILPTLLILFRPLYALAYNHFFANFLTYNLLTLAGCSLLLLIPVVCMGATLPVLSRFYVTKISHLGTNVGRLYGLNTIGAATGSLLCGFWLINSLGAWGSLIFAVILNAIIGISCVLASYTMRTQRTAPASLNAGKTKSRKNHIAENTQTSGWHPLTIFAVSGFCAMAYEVLWTRLLGLVVGPTTYSFTVVLVTFILGLALGSIFFGYLADRVRSVTSLLLFTQIAAALSALLISQLLGNSQIFFGKLIYHFKGHFAQLFLLESSILFILMFIPTFCLGATFPLVGKIYTRSLSQVGRSIGFAYAINTVGAVLGSFCAGFLLIPWLGKEQSLRLIVAVQLLTSLIIGAHILWKTNKNLSKWLPLGLPVLLGFILLFSYPHWDRKMLSIGKYYRFENPEIKEFGWLRALFYGKEAYDPTDFGELVFFGDGIGGFTTVIEDTDIFGDVSYTLLNSGKADASTGGPDMQTQTLSAHFPLLFHENPRSVLVVGLASGVTAGEVLHYPVERLDIVEISDQVVAASNFFVPWNNNVLTNPKTELIIQDGLAHMELTNRKYDIIISEPSNPWMAGLAALFTKEFFELARDRLADGGIFTQWIQSYEMDWPTFALVGRTFEHVFPNSLLVRCKTTGLGGDFLLVGLKDRNGLDAHTAARNLPYAQQSRHMTLRSHKLFYNLIISEDLKTFFGEGPINTENWPRLEFAAPKLMLSEDTTISKTILSRRWVGEQTGAIIREILTDLDAQIDYTALTLSFNRPFKGMLDLSEATPSQRDRFAGLMEKYCEENFLTDFSFLLDERLERRCLDLQVEKVLDSIDRVPDRAPVYFHLGRLFSEKRNLDKAISYFGKALQDRPNYAEAHHSLGLALGTQGNLEEAIRHFSKALRIRPDYAEAHNNLGVALVQKGRLEEAIRHFSEALRIEPNYAEAHYNLGRILIGQRDLKEAIRHFSEALRIEPNYAEAHGNLGMALSEQGRDAEAMEHYKEALRINPDYGAIVYYNIACIHARQNEIEESIDWLKKSIKRGFKNWELLRTDKDLENIRDSLYYKDLIKAHQKIS